MNHPPITSVLFDLDNTLLDRSAGFESFCRELYHTSVVMSDTHTEREAVDLMLDWDAQGMRSREDFFKNVLGQWPGVFRDLHQAMQVFIESYPRLMVLEPRIRALLEDMQDADLPTGIVTNGGAIMQSNKIRESGLEGLVGTVVISEEAGVSKPDPRIFEQALSQIQSSPSSTLFVGDNPEADILGAKGIGMPTAWVHTGQEWPLEQRKPDYVIGHAYEIRDIVFP